MNKLYLALCIFPFDGFMQALRASGTKGTLEVLEHVAEEGAGGEWQAAMGGVCSGESLEQAAVVMGWYCQKKYPGTAPALLWTALAPTRFVKNLSRRLRERLEAKLLAGPHGGVIERFREGSIAVERLGDVVFDEQDLAWTRVGVRG